MVPHDFHKMNRSLEYGRVSLICNCDIAGNGYRINRNFLSNMNQFENIVFLPNVVISSSTNESFCKELVVLRELDDRLGRHMVEKGGVFAPEISQLDQLFCVCEYKL